MSWLPKEETHDGEPFLCVTGTDMDGVSITLRLWRFVEEDIRWRKRSCRQPPALSSNFVWQKLRGVGGEL